MLRYMAFRESGSDPPACMLRAECTRRALSLQLSRHYTVEASHKAAVNCLDIDPVDNRYLLSCGADGTIAVHDLNNLSGEPRNTYSQVVKLDRQSRGGHKFSVETVQWYPLDTGMFMSSGMDKFLKVWDTNELTIADEYEFNGIVYSHDMSQIAVQHSLIAIAGQSAKVKLIDIKSGAPTHMLKGHKKAVICVKWSTRDEFLLATGSEDSKVLMWDIRSAKGSLMTLDQHNGDTTAGPTAVNTAHNGMVNGMSFTPEGLNLITMGTDDRVRVWSTFSGANTNVNFGKIFNDCRKCVRLSVSTDTTPPLIFIPHESNIEVFDLTNGDKLDTLRGHYNQINACLFDINKQELYSGGNDRNVLIWTPETSTVELFDDYLASLKTPVTTTSNFVKRVGTMVDTWSSDED